MSLDGAASRAAGGGAAASGMGAVGGVAAGGPSSDRFIATPPSGRAGQPGGSGSGGGSLTASPGGSSNGSGSSAPQQPPARTRSAVFGPLGGFVADPTVTDIFVNGQDSLWVDRGAGLVREAGFELSAVDARALAVRLVALGGRHIDEAHPCVDTRLGDGIRVHAVLPPISPSGALISLRLPSVAPFSIDALEQAGFFEHVPVDRVRQLVRNRTNLLVTGAGGSGKTTLLSALLGQADGRERIVCIEDVAELRIDHPHVVTLEARQANLEGAGELGLERLVREALRMRPDRLVLGECRGAEIRELLAALNTGHDGGAGTLHANSLDDVPARLEALGALANLSPEAVARQAVSAIGAVLHLERTNGQRRLAAIGTLALDARERLVVRHDRPHGVSDSSSDGDGVPPIIERDQPPAADRSGSPR